MSTPLDVALDIGRTVVEARDEERPIDIAVCASSSICVLASGCTRKQSAARRSRTRRSWGRHDPLIGAEREFDHAAAAARPHGAPLGLVLSVVG